VECKNKSDTGDNKGDWNHFKALRYYLSNIPVKHEIKELQKTAILVTALILWKVVMSKYRTYFTGKITLHVALTVNTEQLQHCMS
jgi:hypothetical protein